MSSACSSSSSMTAGIVIGAVQGYFGLIDITLPAPHRDMEHAPVPLHHDPPGAVYGAEFHPPSWFTVSSTGSAFPTTNAPNFSGCASNNSSRLRNASACPIPPSSSATYFPTPSSPSSRSSLLARRSHRFPSLLSIVPRSAFLLPPQFRGELRIKPVNSAGPRAHPLHPRSRSSPSC